MGHTQVPMMYATMLVFEVIATACMCLRFYSKRSTRARWFLDDTVLLISWIVGTINIGIALWMTRYGLGWQAKDIDPESYADLEHFGPGTAFTTTTAGYVSKLSFFITLLRLVSGWQRKAPLWFFMITCCASYFVLSIIQPFYQCNKLKPWRTTCIAEEPVNAFQVYVSIYGTIVDFLLSLVPTLVILKAKMRLNEKVVIICAMSTGLLATVNSILKVYYNYKTLYGDIPRDPYMAGVVSALASLEVSCTIIAASIPFFRPLIRRMTGKKDSYWSGGGVITSPMSGSRQSSYNKKQEAGNNVSVLEVEVGQRTLNYFGR